jgi:hypothetical protein
MSNCLCEFLSTVWMQLLHRVRSPEASLDAVLESLTAKQIQIELLDRRCVSEARRHHACNSRALFRAKMLEHRRLQAQLLQLQRYRENVHAQLDALSHHEINQTFVRAMASNRPQFSKEEAESTIDNIQETVNSAKEMTELLGQPIDAGLDVMDEDLEEEFMDTIVNAKEEERVLPALQKNHEPAAVVVPPPMKLVLPAMLA